MIFIPYFPIYITVFLYNENSIFYNHKQQSSYFITIRERAVCIGEMRMLVARCRKRTNRAGVRGVKWKARNQPWAVEEREIKEKRQEWLRQGKSAFS